MLKANETALAEHGSRADKHERVESDHPHADWAHSRREWLATRYLGYSVAKNSD